MIAVDTNILVYAHRKDSEWHEIAYARMSALAEGRANWAIPWPCVHEFFSVATHPKIYNPPSTTASALDQVTAWMEAPGLVLLSESSGYWKRLHGLVIAGKTIGPRVHDARIAAMCLEHGVGTLWSADRDFKRFPDLNTLNPLIG